MRAGTPAWLPSTRGWMARDATHAHESVQKPTVDQGSLQSLWIHRCLPESSRSPKKQKDLFFSLVLTQIPPSYPSLSSWKGLSLLKKIVSFAARKEMLSKYRVAYHRPYRKFDSLEMPDFLTKPKKKGFPPNHVDTHLGGEVRGYSTGFLGMEKTVGGAWIFNCERFGCWVMVGLTRVSGSMTEPCW